MNNELKKETDWLLAIEDNNALWPPPVWRDRVISLQNEVDRLRVDARRWQFVEANPWRAIDLLRDGCSTHPAVWHLEARDTIDTHIGDTND